jgi:TetR/AcrR family transcriptional regulator, transcriptional repressor for nem operon
MPRKHVREKLLSAGYRLLYRRGFNATSVQDITDAAGVPKGSFYNHFESKEAIATAAVMRYVANVEEAAQSQAIENAALPPFFRLRKHFEDLVDDALESQLADGCLLGNFSLELSNQSDVVREKVVEGFDQWIANLASLVAEAQSAGTASKDVPSGSVAAALIDAFEGALLRAKAEKSRAPLDLFLRLTFPKLLA